MPYEELEDNFGRPYFGYLTDPELYFNATLHWYDFALFNHKFLRVTPRVTGAFSRDITSGNEEVIIALITLFLLLVIDGILTTVLLRTSKSSLRPISFSVKLVLELIKDINLPALQRKRTGVNSRGRIHRLPKRLIFAAVTLLVFVFGLEAVILILTQPHARPLYNTRATIRVLRPLTPQWKNIRFNYRASLDRPCAAIQILQAVQKNTRISACVTANLTGGELELFKKLDEDAEDVKLTIMTFVHDYGMDHRLTMDNLTAEYVSRVYFSLDDELHRLMSAVSPNPAMESNLVQMMHVQYIGYLFSIYKRATKDDKVNAEYLNSLKRPFEGPLQGPDIYLTSVNGTAMRTKSTKYLTTSTGRFPRGSPALRVGHHTVRSSIGIKVVDEGNTTDLFLGEGVMAKKAVLWYEKSRPMNWLTLTVTVGVALSLLIILRLVLKPVVLADIAASLVWGNTGADVDFGSLEVMKSGGDRFGLCARDTEYCLGAETGERMSQEYLPEIIPLEVCTKDGSRRSIHEP